MNALKGNWVGCVNSRFIINPKNDGASSCTFQVHFKVLIFIEVTFPLHGLSVTF